MPFLWGEHAAIYYSIRSQVTQNLDKQITMAQVVNLLNKKKIENTIKNYPLNRDLQVSFLIVLFKHVLIIK